MMRAQTDLRVDLADAERRARPWREVADGTRHDPRCSEAEPCLRCERDAAQAALAEARVLLRQCLRALDPQSPMTEEAAITLVERIEAAVAEV
jgi:hypothetical protein